MIEIDLMPQFQRHVAQIPVIAVLLQYGDVALIDIAQDPLRHSRLSGSASTANSNNHGMKYATGIVPQGWKRTLFQRDAES